MSEQILEKKEIKNEQTAEISTSFSEKKLEDVLMLEKKCFPIEWQYGDEAEGYYKEKIKNKRNINVFLVEKGSAVGYLLAVPMEKWLIDEMSEYDPEIKVDPKRMYVDTIQILSEFRGSGGAKKILLAMCEEAKKRGIEKFAIHARTINNFNEKIKKLFEKKVFLVRKIENWKPASGEPYEYIEWEY